MSKCKGCGLVLQNTDKTSLGYTPKLTNKLCERCFKIANYGYHDEGKYLDNDEICDNINKKKAFSLFMCDVFSLNDIIIELFNKINNPKYFVLTKVDLLPNNIDYKKITMRIKESYHLSNVILCSIKNETGMEDIKHLINTYQKVIFCGPTSSGKSSLINHLFDYELTVSAHKNTTQEFISLKKDNFTLIDAPGFINDILISKDHMIKPKTLFIKKDYELVIDNCILSFEKDTPVVLYFLKDTMIKTRKIRKENSHVISANNYSDITIKNLGFIYLKEGCNIGINNPNDISIRQSIVGGL